jgi:hypothetical protein
VNKKTAIAVGVLVALAAVVVLMTRPKHSHVERSVVVNTAPSVLWRDVAALSAWPQWTDWNTTTDPSYDPQPFGRVEGVGSKLKWTKSQLGPGVQVITQADPMKGIAYEVSTDGGVAAIRGRLAYEPDGPGKTRITWSDERDGVMDAAAQSTLGTRLEKSLASLKSRAEARAATNK